jgi:diacylglycerol kinase family enzyme
MTIASTSKLPAPPLYVVLNPGSGRSEDDDPVRVIAKVLDESGRTHEIFCVEDPARLGEIARLAVTRAQQNDGIVVAVGGDGTLNAVAQATLGSGCGFGVIPQGTFNYFGRTHGISSETAEATRALLTARVHPAQVGLINDRIFLVNASLGLYPESLEIREEQTQRLGRSRLVAAWAGLLTIFRDFRPMTIKLELEDGIRELRTLTLFVSNNRLQVEQMGVDADTVGNGKLAVFLLRPVSKMKLVWLVARAALGRLDRARDVDTLVISGLAVSTRRPGSRHMKVSIDGEVVWMTPPVEFRVAPEPLLLLRPVDAEPETAR